MTPEQRKWLEKIPSREILDDILKIKFKNKEIGMAQMVKTYQVWHELHDIKNEIEKLGI